MEGPVLDAEQVAGAVVGKQVVGVAAAQQEGRVEGAAVTVALHVDAIQLAVGVGEQDGVGVECGHGLGVKPGVAVDTTAPRVRFPVAASIVV
ncbi:hypothetical protein [Nonomuraea jabiensis]|uniref:hypothetical protein n=1 Tax=Nonomuraea jabiensis TaxID=882448 RepID=UPI003678A04D